jgi:2-polyprenyl-6-hydroxyphenyl methylase/3-demethylubiquinone-9 3-methyltransferase
MDSVAGADRYEFGENWSRFLRHLDHEQIADAEESLRQWLGTDSLSGKRFLDAGSGSGLFSLAARRLGATVHSFDYDPMSVRCTAELRQRYFPDDPQWRVERGSVLDRAYVDSLGKFDVVYSWGVLHHTGSMWKAMETVLSALQPGGKLFISLYNDQGWISRYWTMVKAAYNRFRWLRPLIVTLHAPYLIFGRWLAWRIKGTVRKQRGMRVLTDAYDWLGGYPFEVATPEKVVTFYRERGLSAQRVQSCGRRMGCNEFVFARVQ